MPTRRDSLRRAMREREAARQRGDEQTAALLDRAIDDLIIDLDRDPPDASDDAGSRQRRDAGTT